jgi:transcriptional regulator with XRE-family HTH domain
VESDDFTWSAEAGALLRRIRLRAGLKQRALAQRLIQLGAPATTNQSTVSKWERGTAPSSYAALRAIHGYLAEHAPANDAADSPASNGGPDSDADEEHDTSAHTGERFFRDATGEPMLGPIQLEIVRAQINRLANGPPMTEEDSDSLSQLLALYRLGPS